MPRATIKGTIGPTQELMERTPLNKGEEADFQKWIARNKIKDLDHPDSHYDYRGFWKKYPDFSRAPGEHLTDEFKQHGHESFSRESNYSQGPDDGGRWIGDDENAWLAPSNKSIRETLDRKKR